MVPSLLARAVARRWLIPLGVALAVLAALPRSATADSVDLVLVVANDVSRSVDDSEFQLERQGYASAMSDPKVLAAIRSGRNQAIAVCMVEWSSASQQKVVVDWAVVRDEATAKAWGAAVVAAPRSCAAFTTIGAGIDFAMEQIARSGFNSDHLVIDVAGDGTNNSGRPVNEARDDAVKAGVTINGLAIINDHPAMPIYAHVQPPGGLDKYYQDNVIGGAGSFVMVVHDFATFASALVSKLVREIAEAPPNDGTPAHAAKIEQ
ncbi:MAG: DUF1194 domain-containing protein [Proteobacteria bacterium]|nr:DUF1194 domain-containing protein [Pseudomonadota bacterium]